MVTSEDMLIAQDLLGIKNELKKLREGITVAHIYPEQRYKIAIERAASTKGVDGFKVEASGDSLFDVEAYIDELYVFAMKRTTGLQPFKIEEGK